MDTQTRRQRPDSYDAEVGGWNIFAEDREGLLLVADIARWIMQHGVEEIISTDPIVGEQHVKT